MESWSSLLTSIGFLVFFIGIVLILLGILLAIIRGRSRAEREDRSDSEARNPKVRGAGVVVIGPIPIIFGTDRKALLIAVVAALILMVLYLFVFLLKS
jgi:uncharacterized protein (TIGR00304 family)